MPASVHKVIGAVVVAAVLAGRCAATTLQPQVIADSLDSPVSMAFAPDGRLFVCEQGGRVRIVRGAHALARPFLRVPTVATEEEGLLAIAFSPAFARDHHVFVHYTAASPARHNRIVRFTARGDTVQAGSEVVILELDPLGGHQHVGGALRFGADGMLYVATGDNGNELLAQSLHSTAGKLLRVTATGAIPADNPFVAIAHGTCRAIWVRGLRNPFAIAVQPGTGRIFVDDVGEHRYEEVNDATAGANYGWPMVEGPGRDTNYVAPIHAYAHEQGCAITGGAFYARRGRSAFPPAWDGRYLYCEYCAGEVRWFDPEAPDSFHVLARTPVPGPVDLREGPDGALYVLCRGNAAPTGGEHSSLGSVVRLAWRPGR